MLHPAPVQAGEEPKHSDRHPEEQQAGDRLKEADLHAGVEDPGEQAGTVREESDHRILLRSEGAGAEPTPSFHEKGNRTEKGLLSSLVGNADCLPQETEADRQHRAAECELANGIAGHERPHGTGSGGENRRRLAQNTADRDLAALGKAGHSEQRNQHHHQSSTAKARLGEQLAEEALPVGLLLVGLLVLDVIH